MKKIVIGAFALVLVSISYSQKLELKIDQIFKEWNQEGHPGGVLMIKKKGELLCSKAYGKANIKYQVPNANETVFNIGSTSKQFTAMGVVKLYLENKLSFDDDIRKYLPELQEFEQVITIRHLLHHTSGFRSTPELFALAGWRDGDAITTEDDYHYLCKQTSLNFSPGEQFMYANSNYVLLAKLVEHITQEPFQLWMKTNVFEPLNMKHTFIDETNANANPKVATPYSQMGENQFLLAENISLNIGASNTYTTAEDLTIWMSNFQQPAKGWEKAFELLQTTDTLNNGELNKYAFGVLVDEFFGNKRIQHSGGVPGFLSYAEYYPEEEMTIVLLTNFIAYTVQQKQMELLKLLLKNKSPKREKPITLKPLPLDVENAKKVVGDYWNTKKNYPRKIYYENDTLWYLRDNGIKSQLVQTNDNEFVIGGIKALVIVQFEHGEQKKMIVQDGNRGIEVFEAYDNRPLTEKEKRGYLGRFYNQELETFYEIKIENGHLIGYHSRHGSFPVNILKRDLIDWSGMAIARYARDNNGTITGFFIDMNRVENVWFQKVVCE